MIEKNSPHMVDHVDDWACFFLIFHGIVPHWFVVKNPCQSVPEVLSNVLKGLLVMPEFW